MKYKIIKELPFIKVGEIFGTGSWVGGGYGVDRGTTHYDGGGSSHNGIRTFNKHENEVLENLIRDGADYWIEKMPETKFEVLKMFKSGEIGEGECLDKLSSLSGDLYESK